MVKKSLKTPQKINLNTASLIVSGIAIIGLMIMASYVHAMQRDTDLNRLKTNIDNTVLANLRECYIKGDKECPDSKYIDAAHVRQDLRDFFTK